MSTIIYHRIRKFQKKYVESTFDQDDVYILLMDLRDFCTCDESHIREIADYLAHPQRSKGLTFEKLQKVHDEIVPRFKELWGNSKDLPELPIIFKETTIFREMDSIFERIGMPLIEIKKCFNDRRAVEFSLCILGLLCDAKIKIGDSICKLRLGLGSMPRNLALYADLPIKVDDKVMTLHWSIFQSSGLVHRDCINQVFPWGDIRHIVARRHDDGKMAIYKLETDLKKA